ncbi:MAG: hypothetical protein IJI65_04365 [Lachnospiraceae bacterium]|nr:hypothetical protein [Lachnospiraceae bacterium]
MIMTPEMMNNRQPKKVVKREDPRKLSHEDDAPRESRNAARTSNASTVSSSAKKPTKSKRPDLIDTLGNSIENQVKTRTIEGASRAVQSLMSEIF